MTSLRSLDDLLAVVPYLLGFHPTECALLLGTRDSRIAFQLRADLPQAAEAGRFAARNADVVVRQRATAAVLLGYGPGPTVTPVVDALRAALASRGVEVLDALRVDRGRYWSYLCTEPRCCPAEGRRFDPASHPLAVEAVVAGRVALPSRRAPAERLAPIEGPARAAMTAATNRAGERLVRLLSSTSVDPGSGARAAGTDAVDRALARHRAGDRLTDDE